MPSKTQQTKLYTMDWDDNLLSLPSYMYTYSLLEPLLLPVVILSIKNDHPWDFPQDAQGWDLNTIMSKHSEADIVEFITMLQQRKLIILHLGHVSVDFLDQYIAYLKTKFNTDNVMLKRINALFYNTNEDGTNVLKHLSTIQIVHQPLCLLEAKGHKPEYIVFPPTNQNSPDHPGKKHRPPEKTCSSCVKYCQHFVQNTQQYAEGRGKNIYFHREDAYRSFKTPSQFNFSLFHAITETNIKQEVAEDGVTVIKEYQTGMLPRNALVYQSLKRSYEFSKQILISRRIKKGLPVDGYDFAGEDADEVDDDDVDDDGSDDSAEGQKSNQTEHCNTNSGQFEIQDYRYLDMFSTFDDEYSPNKAEVDMLKTLPHALIVKRLDFMFNPEKQHLLYEIQNNTFLGNDDPSGNTTTTDTNDQRYGHFLKHPAFGQSLSRLLDAVLQNHYISIITSRGQPCHSLQRGILSLLLWLLTQKQLTSLCETLYESGYYCLCDFVTHIPIYSVHSAAFLEYSQGTINASRSMIAQPNTRYANDEEVLTYYNAQQQQQQTESSSSPQVNNKIFIEDLLTIINKQPNGEIDPTSPAAGIVDPIAKVRTYVYELFKLDPKQRTPEAQKTIAMTHYIQHVRLTNYLNNLTKSERKVLQNNIKKRINFVTGSNYKYHPTKRYIFNHPINNQDNNNANIAVPLDKNLIDIINNNFYAITSCDMRYKMGKQFENEEFRKIVPLNDKERHQFKCYCHCPTIDKRANKNVKLTNTQQQSTSVDFQLRDVNLTAFTGLLQEEKQDSTTQKSPECDNINTELSTNNPSFIKQTQKNIPPRLTTATKQNVVPTPLDVTDVVTSNRLPRQNGSPHHTPKSSNTTPSKRRQASLRRNLLHNSSPYSSTLTDDIQDDFIAPFSLNDNDVFYTDDEDDDYNTFPSTVVPEAISDGTTTTTTTTINTNNTLYETDISESEANNSPIKLTTPGGINNPVSSGNENKPIEYSYTIGFSDDDLRNVDAMELFFNALAQDQQYKDTKFVLYDTSQPGVLLKKVIQKK